jgi:hypothetical protein
MRKFALILLTVSLGISGFAQDRPPRGPYNILDGGVIDGVVIKDEIPVREAIPYEHVRLADYVWSKRVFSRIDTRERMNHDLFFPVDFFEYDPLSGSLYKPRKVEDIDDALWNKDQKRWSLWTVIMRHILLGELTVYQVASEANPTVEDGFSLKYPIVKQSQSDYFETKAYKAKVNSVLASGGIGSKLRIYRSVSEDTMDVIRTDQTLDKYLDSLKGDSDYEELLSIDREKLQTWWDMATVNGVVRKDAITMFVASNSIIAYNIKEDWFFDKERSIFDRRIIAIAPVARYTFEQPAPGEKAERGELLVFNEYGKPLKYETSSSQFDEYTGKTEEREMFWLYFPELRNIMVNYYVYNDKSDAQWMSFDDVFWKRKFTAQIYKVSDKFDRELEDFKYGVDALYEAEKIKDDMRKWEHDVWNY